MPILCAKLPWSGVAKLEGGPQDSEHKTSIFTEQGIIVKEVFRQGSLVNIDNIRAKAVLD